MSTRRIDQVENNVFHKSSRINSTWGGNLVDMVRCVRYLQIIKEDKLVENAATVGAIFKRGLEGIQSEFPTVSNVRGRGLMVAFDLPDGDTRGKLHGDLWEAGLAALVCGPKSIRFRPSLTFSEADVAKVLEILRGVLAAQSSLVSADSR
jgi:L-lysine 6-transaminase